MSLWGCGEESSSSSPPVDNYRLGIEISTDSTYITEPLLRNGTPDYAAAMNDATELGVMLHDNAVQLLAPVLGMSFPEKLSRRLDIATEPVAPEERMLGGFSRSDFERYFRSLHEMVTEAELERMYEAFVAEQEILRDGYCSKKECPLIADWLNANERPLAILAEAASRPRYWVPAQERVNFYVSPIPELDGFDNACAALSARAALRLNDGEWASAGEDILTAHRLGMLLGQSTLMRDQAAAATCIGRANVVLRRSVADPALDIPAAKSLLGPLNELLAVGNFGLVAQHERFMGLAGIFLLREILETKPAKAWKRVLRKSEEPRPAGFYRLDVSAIDWNEAVRLVNDAWDLALEVAWSSTNERAGAVARFEEALRYRKDTPETFAEPLISQLLDPSKRDSDARTRLTRAFVDAAGFLPGDVASFVRDTNETIAELKLGTLALALIVYRTENGSLPESLESLTPDYLDQIPPATEFGHVLRVSRDPTWPELALTLVPEIFEVTGTRSFCMDSEGRNLVLPDGREPRVVDGRCYD